MLVRVKNLNGTADRRPPTGYVSWKDFWKAKKGYWPSKCAVYGCTDTADVGAHVKKVNSVDNSWYIVPVCSYHNNQFGKELTVDDSMLVPLNR